MPKNSVSTTELKTINIGPLTTSHGVDKAINQIKDAVERGVTVLCGGKPGNRAGYFFKQTILRDMNSLMAITNEESFAPLAALYRFKTEDEVVKLAGDAGVGLASYVFTGSVDRCWRMMARLEAGMVGVNTGNSSAAESPFGGMKMSGNGKESGKNVAVAEYLVSKTCTLTLER